MDDVVVLLLFGFVGYALVKLRFPLAPLILGLILGDQIEVNLLRAIMSDANPWLFVTRPISGALLALSVASVILALWQHQRHKGRAVEAEQEPDF
jgi:putative tricarboxylic transport membrane protein